jgi:hypothetical protein
MVIEEEGVEKILRESKKVEVKVFYFDIIIRCNNKRVIHFQDILY